MSGFNDPAYVELKPISTEDDLLLLSDKTVRYNLSQAELDAIKLRCFKQGLIAANQHPFVLLHDLFNMASRGYIGPLKKETGACNMCGREAEPSTPCHNCVTE
jgi:hypothetical protein